MRSSRKEIAQQTVEIVSAGSYTSPAGLHVDIGPAIRECVERTQFFLPEDLEQIRQDVLSRPVGTQSALIEVVNETTLKGIARLAADGHGPIAALNFASAKNPGGGFLGGTQAQEESLARSSALYASLCRCKHDFYDRHRALSSLLYTNAMIVSPGCPILRDDDGTLLETPRLATFITSAAPNAGTTADNRPEELPLIPGAFRERTEFVLALAASQGYKHLVLGAWGCGVFRNDPDLVATTFMNHLRNGWANRFERILFSVLDRSTTQETFEPSNELWAVNPFPSGTSKDALRLVHLHRMHKFSAIQLSYSLSPLLDNRYLV